MKTIQDLILLLKYQYEKSIYVDDEINSLLFTVYLLAYKKTIDNKDVYRIIKSIEENLGFMYKVRKRFNKNTNFFYKETTEKVFNLLDKMTKKY